MMDSGWFIWASVLSVLGLLSRSRFLLHALYFFFHFFDLFCFHCATTSAIWNFISFCAITRFCDLIYSNELMFNGLTHGSTCFYIHIFDDEFENYFPTKQPISDAHNLAFDIEKLHLRLLFGSFLLHSNVCLFSVPCHSKCVCARAEANNNVTFHICKIPIKRPHSSMYSQFRSK